MDQRTESLKREVDETREAMTAKMEQIETQVQGKVEDVKSSAQDTVENIKSSAQETIDTVKEKIDIERMVDERPWTMLGTSVAVGFILGNMMRSSDRPRYEQRSYRPGRSAHYDEEVYYYYERPTQATASNEYRHHEENPGSERPNGENRPYRASQPSGPPPYRAHYTQTGFMATLQDQFGDEIEAFKRAALQTATGTVRDLMRENLPRFADEFDRARNERERQHREGTALPSTSPEYRETSSAMPHGDANTSDPTASSIVAPVETQKA